MAVWVLLNNFLHDFSAAGWFVGAVLLWSILRRSNVDPAAESVTVDILRTLLILMRLSILGIVVFGLVRALAYKTYEWNAAAGQAQVTLLIVKHIIMTAFFGWGLVYYLRASRRIRKYTHEQKK